MTLSLGAAYWVLPTRRSSIPVNKKIPQRHERMAALISSIIVPPSVPKSTAQSITSISMVFVRYLMIASAVLWDLLQYPKKILERSRTFFAHPINLFWKSGESRNAKPTAALIDSLLGIRLIH